MTCVYQNLKYKLSENVFLCLYICLYFPLLIESRHQKICMSSILQKGNIHELSMRVKPGQFLRADIVGFRKIKMHKHEAVIHN